MILKARWKRIGKSRDVEEFLKAREPWCVSAGARFLHLDRSQDHLWEWTGAAGKIGALIFQSKKTLFAISGDDRIIPPPRFLGSFLHKNPIHAIQGLRKDAEQLEASAAALGFFPEDPILYDLMALDRAPPALPAKSPPGLFIRKPRPEDTEKIFALQSAYEQEEVLPRGADFSAVVCRANLDHILNRERILVAELDSQVVGKINTSAASFTRYQIGGVYVRPDYRGRGIGLSMAALFARELRAEGRGLSLFVKKRNVAARRVYLRAGFDIIGEYKISYY